MVALDRVLNPCYNGGMVTAVIEEAPFVIGHDWAVKLLTSSLSQDRLAHAHLFVGPSGVGKTTLALYLACALNCLDSRSRPCGKCSSCLKTGQGLHPDVRVYDDDGSRIKIDQIRALQRETALSPFEGRWRVHVLCNFERATVEAANCLLKTLEEPPPRVVLVLTAHQSEVLLQTIVSRCQVLHLRAQPIAQVQQALRSQWGIDGGRAEQLARLSEGRIGWAVTASRDDTLLRNREKYLLALEQALRQGITRRIGLAQQLCQSASAVPDLLNSWQGWWRDILLVKGGQGTALTNVDRTQTLLAEASNCTMQGVVGTLTAIRQCAQQIEQNVNPCLALEVLLLKLPRL